MALTFDNGAANAAVDAITDLLDGGTLELRTGSKPALPSDAATGTLLVTITLGTPSFTVASARSATITDPAAVAAVATGRAAWFRARSSGGTGRVDGLVGLSGSDLNLDNVDIVVGGVVDLSGGTFSWPA